MRVAAYEGYRTLRFERRGRVLRVTIDRPEELNAVDDDMHEDLSRVFDEINRDEGCDVVVLTGAGKAFCAGGDARWLQGMIDQPARFRAIAPAAKRIVFSLLDDMERYVRDICIMPIVGGSSNMQRNNIAARLRLPE